MDIELRHLRVVWAIADAGSVTKAAATLGLAPPALAKQLVRIERSFGGRLFDRDRSGARPTPLGDLVLARARLLLPVMQGLQAEANQLAGAGRSPAGFRLGATNGPIIGGLVRRLSESHPQAHVSTYTSWSSEELAGLLRAGRLDYAVRPITGTPIRWRHLVGWREGRVSEADAALVLSRAAAAYQEVVDRNPGYASWLAAHPQLGVSSPGGVDRDGDVGA